MNGRLTCEAAARRTHVLLRCCGAVLALCMLVLGFRGICAGMAQAAYFEWRKTEATSSLKDMLASCERANSLYGWNYNFCHVAAQLALKAALSGGTDAEGALVAATRWTDKGLVLNPYHRKLRFTRTGLLELRDRDMAVEFWKRHTDWDFWDPFNHHVLAVLYARSGRFVDADRETEWTRGSSYYERTCSLVADARRRLGTAAVESRGGR